MGELRRAEPVKCDESGLPMKVIIGIVLFCFLSLFIGVLSVKRYQKRQFQAAYDQACTYYSEENYEEAINFYQKALNYPSNSEFEIVIKLSNAYIELEEYDEAAELLQAYYDKTKSKEIRNKVEQTIDLLIDSEYEATIDRGNKYSQAQEYNKAVREYLRAYRLKPENEKALELIIAAYLDNSEIEKARQALEEAREQCTQEVYKKLRKEIDLAAVKEQYNALLEEADESFYNESYEECFKIYRKAVQLLPYERDAYNAIVNAYIALQKYDKAIETIKNYEAQYKYSELEHILDRIEEEKETQDMISGLLKKIYYALSDGDIEELISILYGDDYRSYIKEGTTYYYNAVEKRASTQIPVKKGLIIYGSGYIYGGHFSNGKRSGRGRYFGLTTDALGYLLYTGEWKEDLPNGEGVLNTVMQVPYNNQQQQFVVTVQGTYRNGFEDGMMRRDFYLGTSYFGSLEYNCAAGTPKEKKLNSNYYNWSDDNTYVIGDFITIKGTVDFDYTILDGKWKVPGL